jgi:hypothetical protein
MVFSTHLASTTQKVTLMSSDSSTLVLKSFLNSLFIFPLFFAAAVGCKELTITISNCKMVMINENIKKLKMSGGGK